ncbi:MAG TPA: type 1 glutamine amidotransferase [Actinomycetota bacterium]|nr:type 1 glutamine amidotransferase [Actinomycetota bacterium]
MPGILLVRCDPVETFGVAPGAMAAAGATVDTWNAIDPGESRPKLDDVDGVVVFGSTFNVEHADEQPFIKEVADLLRESTERRIPALGVCFGGQLLSWALGGQVGVGPVRELGFEPIHPTSAAAKDPLFSHLADGDVAFQWHGDTFSLPDGADLLAEGDLIVNQAYRVGELAWGTQFHFEVDRAELAMWLEEYAASGGDLEIDWGKSPDAVRREIERHIDGHERRGREIFLRFARVAATAG